MIVRKKVADKKPASESTKSELSRAEILDAAARLFRETGYAATTLRQIAALADMKAGSIYYHFSSKEEILDVVMERGLQLVRSAVQDAVEALPASATHRARIEAAIAAHLEAILHYDDYLSANLRLYWQIPEAIKEKSRRQRRAYSKYWHRLFSEAQRAGEIRADLEPSFVRLILLGALNATIDWFDPSISPPEAVWRKTTTLLFDGLKPQG